MIKFNGTLTKENLTEVASLIFETLKNKRYTFVESHECFNYRPRMVMHREFIDNPIKVRQNENGLLLTVSDNYGMWWLETGNYDKLPFPHIHIDEEKIKVTFYVNDYTVYWLIQVE